MPIINEKDCFRTRDEMTIFHECGHALLATVYGLRVKKIDLKLNEGGLPLTEIDTEGFNRLSVNRKIDFYMAGYAAEMFYCSFILNSPHEHFGQKYVQKVFDETSFLAFENDRKAAVNLMRFPFLKDYRLKLSLERVYNLISKSNHPMFHLFKGLCDNGMLTENQIKTICNGRYTISANQEL